MSIDSNGVIQRTAKDTCKNYKPIKEKPLGFRSRRLGMIYECSNKNTIKGKIDCCQFCVNNTNEEVCTTTYDDGSDGVVEIDSVKEQDDGMNEYYEQKHRLRAIEAKYITKNGYKDNHSMEEDVEFLVKELSKVTILYHTCQRVIVELRRELKKVKEDSE